MYLILESYAAFYWARELIFTSNKLIVFTTSREVSHCVVFSWIMVKRKVGVVLKSIVFFLYVYIPYFLWIVSLHILHLKNEKYTFWSNKKHLFPSALTAKLCVWMPPFLSQLVEVHNSPPVHNWWLRDLEFTRIVWDGSTCHVYGKYQFMSPVERSNRPVSGKWAPLHTAGICYPLLI